MDFVSAVYDPRNETPPDKDAGDDSGTQGGETAGTAEVTGPTDSYEQKFFWSTENPGSHRGTPQPLTLNAAEGGGNVSVKTGSG